VCVDLKIYNDSHKSYPLLNVRTSCMMEETFISQPAGHPASNQSFLLGLRGRI